ncbi:ATP-binding cassette domain-containing protein [Blautia liquoris]|uniref:ATP-binding cassette domain-containing protein n=1 Tax=Blautia liquoris TaxID=2779518 RepID=A0A7M2RM60_9FIRM|nr:ATP-binding cassette domain-containing protein [Blautia liquoris]QOV20442.1 ATP-binding cassette domain-containing protein [Blautia liquoris]
MLEVDIIKKLRQFTLALSFCVDKGCLGILGPSGCGKSMTLKAIAGIVTPDSGSIQNHDRVLYNSRQRINLKPQRRKVGYLFQNYALFPNMTVEQNIGCGLDQKSPKRYDKVKEMISRFQLEGLENSFPARLSGGQQQRVALARILAYEPEVLLLDEPFSAMDAHLKEGLRLQMAEVIRDYQGVTVLVTHDRDEAYQLCDNILLLKDGTALEKGETQELFERPKTVQAARLTGCKNLSHFKKISDFCLWAYDWNLKLFTCEKITDDMTYVGIRAHDFIPLSKSEADEWEKREDANLFSPGKSKISEMPFEWYVTFQNHLWWKTNKSLHNNDSEDLLPPYLRVDPTSILLLKGEL